MQYTEGKESFHAPEAVRLDGDSLWTGPKLLAYAKACENNCHSPSDPAGGPAEKWNWEFQPGFPLEALCQHEWNRWIAWTKQEIQIWTDEGEPFRFQPLLENPIEEPVVIVWVKNKYHIWDGHHRIGCSIFAGRSSIPAIIGRKS